MAGNAVDSKELRATATLPDGQEVEFRIESDGINPPEFYAHTGAGVRLPLKVHSVTLIDGIDEEVTEENCCECGSPDHTCQDCPVFGGGPQ